jgi:hypothetical protein
LKGPNLGRWYDLSRRCAENSAKRREMGDLALFGSPRSEIRTRRNGARRIVG